MIFDSVFNSFRGIVAYFKVLNGEIRKGDKVKFVSTGQEYNAEEIGILKLEKQAVPEISASPSAREREERREFHLAAS